jgi:hypothetical protein
MSDELQFGGASQMGGDYSKLGQWLQEVLYTPQNEVNESSETEHDNQLQLLLNANYHPSFYQQLPDFSMALLQQDPQATVHYAPLLFHLVSCRECHQAYLDLYDALHEALFPRGVRPLLGQGTRTLSATPHRMLSHLCQSLISQAEAVLLQGRHDHRDDDAAARSLLQLALRVSAHIVQSSVRRRALQDLVRVATLFDGAVAPESETSNVHAYTPVIAGSGRLRRGGETASKRVENAPRSQTSDGNAIHIQSRALEGMIVQNGEILELHLQGLSETLRGRHVAISVLLGGLLEPVRWFGGNPRAIRSTVPVDEHGTLIAPLGQTELRLHDPEERNLLEAMFMLLEVQACD